MDGWVVKGGGSGDRLTLTKLHEMLIKCQANGVKCLIEYLRDVSKHYLPSIYKHIDECVCIYISVCVSVFVCIYITFEDPMKTARSLSVSYWVQSGDVLMSYVFFSAYSSSLLTAANVGLDVGVIRFLRQCGWTGLLYFVYGKKKAN